MEDVEVLINVLRVSRAGLYRSVSDSYESAISTRKGVGECLDQPSTVPRAFQVHF